jgi:predicted GIY-YIG superfamily endonuclease
MDEICAHMIPVQKPWGYWTKSKCKIEALKFKSRYDFFLKSPAYQAALKKGFLDRICTHMIPDTYPRNYWTFERCKKEARKYKSRKEFFINSSSAYGSATKNDWLDICCSHMKRIGNRHHKLIYAYEFPDKAVYIGLTFDIENRQKHRDNSITDAVSQYIRKTKQTPQRKILTELLPVNEAIVREGKFMKLYAKKGWKILNKAKVGAIGGNVIKWTQEACQAEARKYNSKSEFYKCSASAYGKALEKGWLDEMCAHMISLKKPNNYWTKERCKQEALKYNTRVEFGLMSGSAYNKALKMKWLDDICTHIVLLRKPNNYWTYELCRAEALKFKSRFEFSKNNRNAYQASRAHGWLDKVCKHMKWKYKKL